MFVSDVLIVKTGTTVPGVLRRRQDFEHWIAAGMGLPDSRVRVCRVFEGEALPEPRAVEAVVVTGSAAMVTSREPWSERTAEWLGTAVAAQTPAAAVMRSRVMAMSSSCPGWCRAGVRRCAGR